MSTESSLPTLPPRKTADHKGTFGRIVVVGGQLGMAGSISLTAIAALRSGAGLVTAVVPRCIQQTVANFHPAVMTIGLPDNADGQFDRQQDFAGDWIQTADAIAIGPGMGTGPGSQRLLIKVLQIANCPIVADADAINIAAKLDWGQTQPVFQLPTVWTPHPGEIQRLLGVPSHDRPGQIAAAIAFAGRADAVVVVKGGPSRSSLMLINNGSVKQETQGWQPPAVEMF